MLHISETAVSDLLPLAGLKNLQVVDFDATPVSAPLRSPGSRTYDRFASAVPKSTTIPRPLAALEKLQELVHQRYPSCATYRHLPGFENLLVTRTRGNPSCRPLATRRNH